MKTIKVKTFSLINNKRNWGTPMLFKNIGTPAKVKNKSDKKLTYERARKKYSLTPYGDTDKDGVINKNDCKPLDPKKHGVTKKYKDKPVEFYDTKSYGVKPGEVTHAMIFERLEKKLPNYFGQEKGVEGGTYSSSLTKSLLGMESGETPVKHIVGVHELEKPGSVSHETVFALKHLQDYISSVHPEKRFQFDIFNPNEVSYVDEKGDRQTAKISTLLTAPLRNVKSSVRVPIHVQKKAQKTKSIIPEIERIAGMKLTDEQKKQLSERLVTEEDIGGISSSHSIEPHWSISELPRHFGSRKDVVVHITDDPSEVIMKSMYPGMGSCENISEGMCQMGAFSDVEHRHPVAYFYLSGKTPYKDTPSARVMMRRGHPVSEEGKLDLSKEYIGVEPTVYGMGGSSEKYWYPYLLQEFLKKKNLYHLPLKTKHAHEGYSDFVAHNPEKAFPYLRKEWEDRITEEAEERDMDYHDVSNILDDRDAFLDYINDDLSHFKGIPSVYAREISKPTDTEAPPTYEQSVSHLLAKDTAIPRSFFYNIIKSPSTVTLKKAISRPEMKKEYYHPLAFHPDISIQASVAKYPKLEEKTTKQLMTSKRFDVINPLFFNPSLTFKQRKSIAKSGQAGGNRLYDVYSIGKEVDPRVAREVTKIVSHTEQPNISEFARYAQNESAMNYIYDNYPKERENLIKNQYIPEYIIQRYISDIAESKISAQEKIKKIGTVLSYKSSMQPETLEKIYRMFGANHDVAETLYFRDDTPPKIRRKIESRIFNKAYSALLRHICLFPDKANIDTIFDILDRGSEDDLKTLLPAITARNLFYYLLPDQKRKMIEKMIKQVSNSSLENMFIEFIKRNRRADTEKILLQIKDYPDDLHREVIRYLMKSDDKSVIDELIKRYG